MDKDKLEKYLDELKTEIARVEETEKESASRLQDLAESIETLVNVDGPAKNDVLENIRGNIEHFEEVHPAVTAVLNRLSNYLSSMGI